MKVLFADCVQVCVRLINHTHTHTHTPNKKNYFPEKETNQLILFDVLIWNQKQSNIRCLEIEQLIFWWEKKKIIDFWLMNGREKENMMETKQKRHNSLWIEILLEIDFFYTNYKEKNP